jgi:hypothetical protein
MLRNVRAAGVPSGTADGLSNLQALPRPRNCNPGRRLPRAPFHHSARLLLIGRLSKKLRTVTVVPKAPEIERFALRETRMGVKA